MLFDILRYSFSSLIWGVLISIACLALFVFLIKGWYKDATFSPISYIIGAVLFVFLSIQCILIVGSLKILDTTDYYEVQIANIVDKTYDAADEVTMGNADDIIKSVIADYPLLQYYISGGEFSGFTAKELPHAIAEELRSFMHWYILRRILWCLGFVIIGSLCVIKSLSRNQRTSRSSERIQRQLVQTERRRVSRRSRRI